MAIVDHDGSELMVRLRCHQALAAAVRESTDEQVEIVAEMRVIVAECDGTPKKPSNGQHSGSPGWSSL
jgi:hypothetical protein